MIDEIRNKSAGFIFPPKRELEEILVFPLAATNSILDQADF